MQRWRPLAGEGEACWSSGARSLGGGGLRPLVLGDQVILELPSQGQGAFRVASDAEARGVGLATLLGIPVFLYSSSVAMSLFELPGPEAQMATVRDFRHGGLDTWGNSFVVLV